MKDGHTTHGESSFGKKLWCVLIVLFLGGIGWQVWKINAYNNAVREAKEAGFEWRCEDTFSLIRQDWHNALKKETWGPHERMLDMTAREDPDLSRYREMLHHLRPTVLIAWRCKDENLDALKSLTALQTLDLLGSDVLQNVDGLKSLTGLQTLDLSNCDALQNVDGLRGLTGLQSLDLRACTALQNVDALKGLTALQSLDLRVCPALQYVDALKGLTALQSLSLCLCPALQNVDGLKGFTALQKLDLSCCPSLQNVDALKGLTTLQWLDLFGCDKIPAATLRELRAALPKTDITFPDGTKNPPQ